MDLNACPSLAHVYSCLLMMPQAFRRRFPSLARACVSMLSWEGQEEWASMCLSRARQEPKAYKIHPALTVGDRPLD